MGKFSLRRLIITKKYLVKRKKEKNMKIINQRNNAVLADKVVVADTFFRRLVGLLNRSSLQKGEALILKPSNAIHTLFMRFAIDVLFLDKNHKIVGILPVFLPFRLSKVYFNAQITVELPKNCLEITQTKLGDTVKIE